MTLEDGQSPAGRRDRPLLEADTELADRYRVVRCVGAGGMGTVYEVVDEHLDERVALKLLHPELSSRQSYRQRLRSEVRLARRVSHPNVCRIHDLGRHDEQLFVTMELIEGETLRHMMKETAAGARGALPLPRIIDILVQVCSALSAAHRAGVLHRDVKPDNVLVEADRAVLTDFGVAGLASDTARRRLVAGTPAYIAPEVLTGRESDHRIDVYACAATAYEALTGRQPFPTRQLEAAIDRAYRPEPMPPLPPRCAPDAVRGALETVLSRALDPDPAARTSSVDGLAEGLSRAARRADALVAVPEEIAADAETLLPDAEVEAAMMETIAEAGATLPPSAATPPQATLLRSQIRVATALCHRARPDDGRDETDTSPGERFERVVVDLGGTPLAVRADGITALFGAPVALGDDAARAARAAHALVELAGGRAGIDTARVLWRGGDDGAPSASGDAIDRAGSLADEAEPGQVRASPATARQLVGRFHTRDLSTGVEGLDRALDLRPTAGDEAGGGPGPLLGRERELTDLEELIRQACEQRAPRFGTVLAPAGFGKSRLRLELTRRVSGRREIDWLTCRATPLGATAPFSVLRNADAEWFAAAAASHDHRSALVAARLWLEQRAARRPVVVLVEDAQWIDRASAELLADLPRSLEGVPVTVLCFQRPDAGAPWGQDGSTIELQPLDDHSALELARHVAPTASERALHELARRSGGNPFFVIELARDLRERGRADAAVHTPPTPSQVTPLPETVEAVVQARLDRLPAAVHGLACAAAVVGREFWREAARAALPHPAGMSDAELDEQLAELERRGIAMALPPVTVDDDRYVFHSALVRDVAYQQLAPRERRRAHAAVASWLERRTPGLSSRDPSILSAIAQHRDAAGDEPGARDAWRATGQRSLELHAYREAMTALSRATALSDDPDPALLEPLGDAAASADSYDTADRAYRDALGLADTDRLATARLWRKLGHCCSALAKNDESRRCYERALGILAPGGRLIAEAEADPREAAAAYGGLGWLLGYQLDDNAAGLPHSERAVALLEATQHRGELAQALSRLGGNYQRAGRWRDQLRCNQRHLDIARELDDPSVQVVAHINLGVTYANLGEIDRALEHTRRGLGLCARLGEITKMALVHSNLGGLLLENGELEQAQTHLDEGVRLAEKVGNRRFLPEAGCHAARLALRRGNLDGARHHAQSALELARRTGLRLDEGITARILAGISIRQGRHDQAARLLATSRERLEDADAFENARTQVVQARLLDAGGDDRAAARLRDGAAEVFRRLGAERDLAMLADPDDLR